MAVGCEAIAAQLVPGGHRPDIGLHAPVIAKQLLRAERPVHADPAGKQLHVRTVAGALADEVHAAQDAIDVDALWLGGLHVGLVVDRQVVEDVLRLLAIHPAQAVLDDVAEFVAIGRVVCDDTGIRGGEEQGVAVLVLQALAVQGRSASSRAENEAAGHLVHCGPEAVAGALEPEHRVEDVDGDHRLALRGVGGADRRERGDRPGLVDALVEDLPGDRLLVGEHELTVDRDVLLPVRGVDLGGGEERVHAEGTRLVGDDRHEPVADVLVLEEVLEHADERHRGRDRLLARTAADGLVCRVAGQGEGLVHDAARRHRAAELAPGLQRVLDDRVARARVVVRRQVRVHRRVGDRDVKPVAELLEVIKGELLHLMG